MWPNDYGFVTVKFIHSNYKFSERLAILCKQQTCTHIRKACLLSMVTNKFSCGLNIYVINVIIPNVASCGV